MAVPKGKTYVGRKSIDAYGVPREHGTYYSNNVKFDADESSESAKEKRDAYLQRHSESRAYKNNVRALYGQEDKAMEEAELAYDTQYNQQRERYYAPRVADRAAGVDQIDRADGIIGRPNLGQVADMRSALAGQKDAVGRIAQLRGQQMQAAGMAREEARGDGPSLANAQAQMGRADALRAALGASSGGGLLASRQATGGASQMGLGVAQQAGAGRAAEIIGARGRLMDQLGGIRGADIDQASALSQQQLQNTGLLGQRAKTQGQMDLDIARSNLDVQTADRARALRALGVKQALERATDIQNRQMTGNAIAQGTQAAYGVYDAFSSGKDK